MPANPTAPTAPSPPPLRSAPESRSALPWPLNPVALTGLGLALLAFLVYVLTLSPSIGFIDSGELVTATKTLVIVHPTGYPVYTLLGYLVTNFLPLGEDPAWRLNLLSAFFGALAVGLMYLVAHHVLARLSDADAIEPKPAGPKAKHGHEERRGRARAKAEAGQPPGRAQAPPDAGHPAGRSILLIAVAACSAGLLGGAAPGAAQRNWPVAGERIPVSIAMSSRVVSPARISTSRGTSVLESTPVRLTSAT